MDIALQHRHSCTIRCPGARLTWRCSRFSVSLVFCALSPCLLPHEGWSMAAGPASRSGSTEPGDKTGLRPSPALALAPRSGLTTTRASPDGLMAGSAGSEAARPPGRPRCSASLIREVVRARQRRSTLFRSLPVTPCHIYKVRLQHS